MKQLLLLTAILLHSFSGFAQAKPKPKPKEKPPTQKEMEAMMKEAQEMMDNMDPEEKRMADSLGIKLPSFKNTPKVGDKQLAEAYYKENRIVPKKDAARIANIPAPVSTAGIGTYLQTIDTKISAVLPAELKNNATALLQELKKKTTDPALLGKAAVGMWVMGKVRTALYLQLKICEADAGNGNNLSNLTAMFIQLDGAEYAIPLLNNLNARFKNNSSILNNLGQAWFALGDIPKAEKYIDSTIRIYANHSQANFTKCLIEESKGKKPEAIIALKRSIKGGYTKEKETKLKHLGGIGDPKDDYFPQNKKTDPLQLGNFKAPDIPKSVAECITLEAQWKTFEAEIDVEINQLLTAYKNLNLEAKQEQRMQQSMAIIIASQQAGKPVGNIESTPLYFERAARQLKAVQELHYKKLEALLQKAAKWAAGEGAALTQQYQEKMNLLRKQDGEQTGYGRANIDFCPQYRDASDAYLRNYNAKAEEFYKEYISLHKAFINEISHWEMYMYWPDEFEALKINNKIDWLKALKSKQPIKFISITQYKCVSPLNRNAQKLAKFDDVACQYHSEVNYFIGKIKSDCSKTTAEFDFEFLKYDIEMNAEQGTTFSEQFVRGSIEVSEKIGSKQIGPANAEAELGARVEIGRNGIEDFIVKGGVSVSNPTGQSVGVEGNVSLVSGSSTFGGTGIFGK